MNRTPHIDRLAREGAILLNVFATNSICTPSRATILTGQYSHVNGVTMFNRFDGSRLTVARLLQQSGYYTGMIGKWHLGSDPVGFDRWEILPGQGVYMNPVFYTATTETTYAGRYATDVITDRGIEFIKNRPRNKPFFLMLHHKAPHRPWEPDSAHGALFAAKWIPSRRHSGIITPREPTRFTRTSNASPSISHGAISSLRRQRSSRPRSRRIGWRANPTP